MNAVLAGRYGLAGRAAQPAPVAQRPGEAVLDDKPLRVTLNLEVIKVPLPVPAGKKG
jgi:hypothetical protein